MFNEPHPYLNNTFNSDEFSALELKNITEGYYYGGQEEVDALVEQYHQEHVADRPPRDAQIDEQHRLDELWRDLVENRQANVTEEQAREDYKVAAYGPKPPWKPLSQMTPEDHRALIAWNYAGLKINFNPEPPKPKPEPRKYKKEIRPKTRKEIKAIKKLQEELAGITIYCRDLPPDHWMCKDRDTLELKIKNKSAPEFDYIALDSSVDKAVPCNSGLAQAPELGLCQSHLETPDQAYTVSSPPCSIYSAYGISAQDASLALTPSQLTAHDPINHSSIPGEAAPVAPAFSSNTAHAPATPEASPSTALAFNQHVEASQATTIPAQAALGNVAHPASRDNACPGLMAPLAAHHEPRADPEIQAASLAMTTGRALAFDDEAALGCAPADQPCAARPMLIKPCAPQAAPESLSVAAPLGPGPSSGTRLPLLATSSPTFLSPHLFTQ